MPTTDLSTIVLATRNPGKIAELSQLFAGGGVSVVGIDDVIPSTPEPEEGTASFNENATIKAVAYAAACGMPCLADDSGLEIDALGGAPGVISSHYAFDGETDGPAMAMTRAERDGANNARVLRELENVAPEDRAARFVCVMVLAAADGLVLAQSRGTFEGRIGEPPAVPRGDQGFGYDPLFLVAPDFDRTGAELAAREKNAHSHRGVASRAMLAEIERLRG